MAIELIDVMKYFNQGKGQWWGWKDTANGEVYSNLKLLDDTVTMPTEEEVNAKIAEIQIIENRKIGYGNITDQLDKLWHDINDGKLDKTGTWFLAIKQVKDDNPKG